jgi:hypothetical protein
MSYKLPPNDQWTQKNLGDSSGTIWSSLNLDLTIKKGDAKITRLLKNTSSVDEANLGTPIGFVKYGSSPSAAKWWTVAGARVFSGGTRPNSSFTQDATSGTPTTCSSAYSDIAIFNDAMYVTTTDENVYKLTGTTWSSFAAGAADANNPHILCQYANRMYRTRSDNTIISWNTSDTVVTSGQYFLNLSTGYSGYISFLKAASDRIWIGTVNPLGGSAAIYSWDGSSGNPVKYVINSTGVVSGVVKNDVLYAMDNEGKLLVFNGGTFIEAARLPNFSKKFFHNPIEGSHIRWIHPNGMAVIEDKINILIDTSFEHSTTTPEEMCPSGIWEYDKDIGLYHKYTPSYCTTSVSVTDYGQQRMSVAGGLGFCKSPSTSTNYGTLLAGATIYSDATTTISGIYFDDTGDLAIKTGYIVTTKIPSSAVSDTWQRLVLKYNPMSSGSNKIITKYRLSDVNPVEATITWTSTTTFTTTTDLSAYWTSGTGFECEVVKGTGAGMCSHITSITGSGTYTVTVDEVHTGVTSGTAIARFQKWIKLGSMADTTSTFKTFGFPATASSNYLQLKVFMIMYNADELKEVDIQSVVSQPL